MEKHNKQIQELSKKLKLKEESYEKDVQEVEKRITRKFQILIDELGEKHMQEILKIEEKYEKELQSYKEVKKIFSENNYCYEQLQQLAMQLKKENFVKEGQISELKAQNGVLEEKYQGFRNDNNVYKGVYETQKGLIQIYDSFFCQLSNNRLNKSFDMTYFLREVLMRKQECDKIVKTQFQGLQTEQKLGVSQNLFALQSQQNQSQNQNQGEFEQLKSKLQILENKIFEKDRQFELLQQSLSQSQVKSNMKSHRNNQSQYNFNNINDNQGEEERIKQTLYNFSTFENGELDDNNYDIEDLKMVQINSNRTFASNLGNTITATGNDDKGYLSLNYKNTTNNTNYNYEIEEKVKDGKINKLKGLKEVLGLDLAWDIIILEIKK
ncbi:hypothetical protein PPERSA_11035 [Pseudocohnilembus persalinus]|uniref:Uncharacterized protein n=1 Tax=Pseudocohnilembus persalinus TaxID=266149 RepID=A0A0V0QZ26_PSEPJ|nr:hypothetical protein PPERSA_11035 [Pseudocohnilembus persalinus]|eukprot:KRX07486.1 hypothetical protein PPERSA_11035 [Pseudocohnilembus persalinus]